jgi:hypothetical protein
MNKIEILGNISQSFNQHLSDDMRMIKKALLN